MNNKEKFLFYQLNPLKRLKEEKPKEKGIKEKHIENLFCQNLENIFFGWISLSQQCYLEHPDKYEENCIVDSLAFNKGNKNFLIIEYKKEKAAELVYQVEKYMECLEDEEKGICIRNRNRLVDILNNNLKKTNGIWKEEEIKWGETKGLCIITEIHGYQKILKRKPRENIHVLEIKFYEENFLSIDCEKLPDWLSIERKQKNTNIILSKNDNNKLDYPQSGEEITKLKLTNSNVKKWLTKIDNSLNNLSQSNSLTKEVNNKNINYYPVINYNHKKKILISLVIKVFQINAYWNFKETDKLSNSLLELLNKYRVEYKEQNHRGTGNWHFPLINSDENCQYLEKFIQEYKNYCRSEPKTD